MRRSLALSLIGLSLLCLTACGFHLRRNLDFPKVLDKLYISSATPYGSFEQSLTNILKQAHVTIASDANKSVYVLRINYHQLTQTTASISANTQTRSYRLTYQVNYDLLHNGVTILPNQIINVGQSYISSASQIGSTSDSELRRTIQDLHQLAIGQIINRLSSKDVKELIEKPHK